MDRNRPASVGDVASVATATNVFLSHMLIFLARKNVFSMPEFLEFIETKTSEEPENLTDAHFGNIILMLKEFVDSDAKFHADVAAANDSEEQEPE